MSEGWSVESGNDRVIRFGSFELWPQGRRLLKDGARLPVGARAFDVLSTLVERRERIVTKGELIDAAWPGVVVEENNLPVQIGQLRKLLGRDTIATIPGRGLSLHRGSRERPCPATRPQGGRRSRRRHTAAQRPIR
jgi:DNA-binding winged helix-turn-helix (wHTH) protein